MKKIQNTCIFEQDRNNLFCGFSNRTSSQIYYVSSEVEGESHSYLVHVVHIKNCLFRLLFHVLSRGYIHTQVLFKTMGGEGGEGGRS